MAGISSISSASRKFAAARAGRRRSARDETACRRRCRAGRPRRTARRSPCVASVMVRHRRRVAVHEVDVVVLGDVLEQRIRAQRGELVPAHVRHRAARASAQAPHGVRHHAEAIRRRLLRSARTAAACRGRCRARVASASGSTSRRPGRAQARMASPAAPTPGRITCVALRARRFGSVVTRVPRRAARARSGARRGWRRRCR